jgi:cytoskeletal protein CcmA (bactofilin family)
MWTKRTESQPPSQPQPPNGTAAAASFPQTSGPRPEASRLSPPMARNLASIGTNLEIKGSITGEEDLQIDANVVGGPVVIAGHRLIVGRSAHLKTEVTARELIVYGKIDGKVNAVDRVEIKRDGEVIGDIETARISIEDGAVFKGRIEVGMVKPKAVAKPADAPILAGAGAA